MLLEAFLANQGAALRTGAWPEFERLLEEEDDTLWRWVLRPESRTEYLDLLNAVCRRA